jgi:hypothetical protein
MTPMRVVPSFDPLKDSHLRFGVALESTAVQHFALEGREKALGHRVIVCIADRSHRGHHAGLAAALAEGVACVLGEFNRSLQHFKSGGGNDEAKTIRSGGTSQAVLARAAAGGAARGA